VLVFTSSERLQIYKTCSRERAAEGSVLDLKGQRVGLQATTALKDNAAADHHGQPDADAGEILKARRT
jgi:hypothetical protein